MNNRSKILSAAVLR